MINRKDSDRNVSVHDCTTQIVCDKWHTLTEMERNEVILTNKETFNLLASQPPIILPPSFVWRSEINSASRGLPSHHHKEGEKISRDILTYIIHSETETIVIYYYKPLVFIHLINTGRRSEWIVTLKFAAKSHRARNAR